MIILHESRVDPVRAVLHLVISFEKKTAIIVKHIGFDDDYSGKLAFNEVHFSQLWPNSRSICLISLSACCKRCLKPTPQSGFMFTGHDPVGASPNCQPPLRNGHSSHNPVVTD